jgi:hypothetical protein
MIVCLLMRKREKEREILWLLSFYVASIVPSYLISQMEYAFPHSYRRGVGCLFRKHTIISERERERERERDYNYVL